MYFETNKNIDNSDKVQYNYYPTPFYKNQFQDNIEKNGFIKIAYSSKSNQPNIAVFGAGYVTKNLYITSPIHRIKNVDYDAELIIEHLPLTNFTDSLYTCFLLKTSSGLRTDIDRFIEGSSDFTLELNKYITKQKAVVYKNNYLKPSSVVIFTVPINVGSKFDQLKPSANISLAPYVDEYSVLYTEPILGSVVSPASSPALTSSSTSTSTSRIENFTSSKKKNSPVTVAGYCQPIDESDPSIGESANVIVPMDSSLIKDDAASSTIKTMLNFFGFFVLVIIAVFVSPIAHRILIVELIMDNDTFSAQRKLNRTNAADIYTAILFFGFSLAFINYGIINSKPIATVIGFYVFIFFMASVITLQYQRIFDPSSYLNQFITKGITPSYDNIEMDWGFFTENVFNLFFKTTMEKNTDPVTSIKKPVIPVYYFDFGFVGVIGIYAAFYALLRWLSFGGYGGSFFYTSIHFYGLLFAIYIMALISHYRYQNSKLNAKV